ncbi:MAG: hypothetical protein ACPGYX_10515 [Oceanobacter sp.]
MSVRVQTLDPVAGYLDDLLSESSSSSTDWNQVLDQVVSQAANNVASQTDSASQNNPHSLVTYVTTLRSGMAPICVSQAGTGHSGTQLLDSLALVRQLPAQTRLHQHILGVCERLLLKVTNTQ